MLKIQSIQASLNHIDEAKLVDGREIHSCLRSANKSFRAALKAGHPLKKETNR